MNEATKYLTICMLYIAQIISIIFSPLTFIPLLLLFIIIQSTPSSAEITTSMGIVFGIGVLPVLCSLIFLKYTGQISDWGIANRKQRHTLGLIGIICAGLTAVILLKFGLTTLSGFVAILLLGNIVFSIVTLFWKISAHTTAASLFALFVSGRVGGNFYFVWLLVPLVFWARIVLKKHTILQAFGGVILAGVVYLVGKVVGVG